MIRARKSIQLSAERSDEGIHATDLYKHNSFVFYHSFEMQLEARKWEDEENLLQTIYTN